ncbi:MAG: VCBS repeat-containing protein [Chloroflexota bacterium]
MLPTSLSKKTYYRVGFTLLWAIIFWLSPMQTLFPSTLYANPLIQTTGGAGDLTLNTIADWYADDSEYETTSIAWGDVDNDGDPDLAVGTRVGPTLVYLNVQSVETTGTELLTNEPVWMSERTDATMSIAWGDVDKDGDLDLAVGNSNASSLVYENQAGILSTTPLWTSPISRDTRGIAWADINDDGYLDLTLGNYGAPVEIYLNNAGTLASTVYWSASASETTTSLAWGDVNDDDLPDLAVGNLLSPVRIYLNKGDTQAVALSTTPDWSADVSHSTSSLAWGDVNDDDAIDLATGSISDTNKVYLNLGTILETTPSWSSSAEDFQETQSVAWGDVDNDNDLDLMVGNTDQNLQLYYNQLQNVRDGDVMTVLLDTTPLWSTQTAEQTYSVAWVDVDGDGDLDIGAGNQEGVTKMYLNHNVKFSRLIESATTESGFDGALINSHAVALGDVDNDGDLDVAVANFAQANQLFLNVNGRIQVTPTWSSAASNGSLGLAWGDVDGDQDIDLAVANEGRDEVYLNQNGVLDLTPAWQSENSYNSNDLAWADMDNDNDLDLAVVHQDQVVVIYLNTGTGLGTDMILLGESGVNRHAVAWGDMDGDGDLELATAALYDSNEIFLNNGGVMQTLPVWLSDDRLKTEGIAWGDINGDGWVDLVAANNDAENRVYFNVDGTLQTKAGWLSLDNDETSAVVVGDMDSDGDLDVAVSNIEDNNRVYLNHQGELQSEFNAVWRSPDADASLGIDWGDIDNDGYLDIVVANRIAGQFELPQQDRQPSPPSIDENDEQPQPVGSNQLYIYKATQPSTTPNIKFNGIVLDQTGLSLANGYSLATVHSNGKVTLPYQINTSLDTMTVRAFYSTDGGTWQPAIATSDTITEAVATNTPQTFTWDVYASGLFGQNSNVTLLLEAYPPAGVIHDGLPLMLERPLFNAHTRPFRVQGNTIQVFTQVTDGNGTTTQVPQPDASLYVIPIGAIDGGVLVDSNDNIIRTDQQGILQSNALFDNIDQFVAIAPISATQSYSLYYTSAAVTSSGLALSPLSTTGLHTLVTSPTNPLLIFNLDVSLEWDARLDTGFLAQLEADIYHTAEMLYDWTNGQATLGDVTIYHDKEQWDNADVQIYASNRLRPNADIGGIVAATANETLVVSGATTLVHYTPGAVRMGVVWSRFSNSVNAVGGDWPRAFAHELSHYLFYLQDNYLGLADDDTLIRVDTCLGAMNNPYQDEETEFRPQSDWLPDCEETLSNQLLGRSDWETIVTHYPFLHAPTAPYLEMNQGPTQLPLNITDVSFSTPMTETEVFDAPLFSLINAEGGHYQPGDHARAFLFRSPTVITETVANATQLIDLGRPTYDYVRGWGAQEGDRLCVFETETLRSGCQSLESESDYVTMGIYDTWRPQVQLSIISSSTITMSVAGVDSIALTENLPLKAQLFPSTDNLPTTISLVYANGVFQGTFNLPEPAPSAQIVLWVDESNPQRLIVVDYGLGGAPIDLDGYELLARQTIDSHVDNAPATSSDVQLMLYVPQQDFRPGEFHSIQSTPFLPEAPSWMTIIGKGYYISASENAPSVAGSSMRFRYLIDEIPPGEEDFLTIHRYDEAGPRWEQLNTTLLEDSSASEALGIASEPGLYALMSTLEIPLRTAGWNLFAYPIQERRTITHALASLRHDYNLVYGYNGNDMSDPWRGFSPDPTVPAWANELKHLDFGRGYWIHVDQQIILSMSNVTNDDHTSNETRTHKSGHPTLSPQDAPFTAGIHNSSDSHQYAALPPSTFYGHIIPAAGPPPRVGESVTAWINGVQCGQGSTQTVTEGGRERLVYVVDVQSVHLTDGTCGVAGQEISFQVNGRTIAAKGTWDNSQYQALDLTLGSGGSEQPGLENHIYLPVVR